MILHLLCIDRQLHEVVHLCLRALDVLLLDVWELGESLVGFLLEIKGLAIVSQLVVSMGNRLVAGNNLKMAFAEKRDVAVEAL